MSSDTDDIRARIKRLIVERLFLEGMEPQDIADDAPLRDELGLDSVDALELVLGLEQEFAVKIVNQGIDREAFATVASLSGFVQECIAAQEGEASAT